MSAHNPVDEDQYRKEVLLHPSEESELFSNQKLLDEAHQLGLKVPEIEVTASLTASIASGLVDLSSSSPVLSSGSSTGRNSVCERPGTAHQQQQGQQQGQQQQDRPQKQHAHQHAHHEIPLDQITSSLSELTVSSRPVKSGSVRSIASLSTRPTSYCSSDGKLAPAGSDGATAKPASAAVHNNRHSMISLTPGEKKQKRRESLKFAIDKFPFRRKRTSSAVLLPAEAQITVTKGEQGEEKVYVESKPSEAQSPQPTSAPNNGEDSVMKLEIPVFDHESLQRSLVNAELVKMREAHRLERNRHVTFQAAFMSRLRSRQQASVANRLAENKRTEEEKREKNTANAIKMEERQLAVEMEQQREFDRAKQNARTRIKHMEGYFNNRSPPSSPGSGSEKPALQRKYTSQQKAQLAQEYHDHETMDQLHESKIKVLRERQERRLQEAIERFENELDAMIDKHAEAFSELQRQHQQEESNVLQAFDIRKTKLMHRWNLEEVILRRKLEQQHGQPYGPLPPLTFNDSHYETRDSACCVAGSGDDEQMHQKGDGTMI